MHFYCTSNEIVIQFHQTSANASTRYCYSSKLCSFVNYSWMNLLKITSNYSIFTWLEHLYFGWIWRIIVEAKRSILFMFLTICGSKSNNYSTLMHKTWITWIIIHLTTQKWPNIIQYLAECYSIFALIFASRLNTSTANHHIFASPTIRLRYQSFGIRLDDEARSGTPLRQNLPATHSAMDWKRKINRYFASCSSIEVIKLNEM